MPNVTPLDSLKDLLLRADNLISMVQDNMSAAEDSTQDVETDLEILDSVRKLMWDAVAAHVVGVRYEWPHYTSSGAVAAQIYDDGTPVVEHIELSSGSRATYFPRHDGDRAAYVEKMEGLTRHLTLIQEPVGTGITSLQDAALRHLGIVRSQRPQRDPQEQTYVQLAFAYGLTVPQIVEASGLAEAHVQGLLAGGGE